MMWGHGFDGFGWGGMLAGGLMMVLFWGGLLTLAVLVLRTFSGSGPPEGSTGPFRLHNTTLDILQERYARGEITRAEYEEMRDVLET